jgi:dTDP-glucose pyrophosphorylase
LKAVIVAAGRGKRLMPLTADRPKPLVHVCGHPILDYLLYGLKQAGIYNAVIVVRYLGEQIIDYYGNGSKVGMALEYAWQEGPDGTGSALLAAVPYVGDLPFMLLWGDVLMDPINYSRILHRFKERPCALLSGLNWVDDPTSGAAVFVEGNRIVGITEKPPAGQANTHWNQAGLFICTEAVIEAVKACGLSSRGEIEFTSAVQILISSGADIQWLPIEGFWSDIGTPETVAFLNANPHLLWSIS